MIGNMNTFRNSRSGKAIWSQLFEMFLEKKYLFDGFPVKCEKHPNRTMLIKKPEEFDTECPSGGCTEPWYDEKFFFSFKNFIVTPARFRLQSCNSQLRAA